MCLKLLTSLAKRISSLWALHCLSCKPSKKSAHKPKYLLRFFTLILSFVISLLAGTPDVRLDCGGWVCIPVGCGSIWSMHVHVHSESDLYFQWITKCKIPIVLYWRMEIFRYQTNHNSHYLASPSNHIAMLSKQLQM